MLLITGGTNFLGRAVLRQLTRADYQVRTLLQPSRRSPDLPRGVRVDVALASLSDWRGLRAAMVGVKTVIHLSGALASWGREADQLAQVNGTRNLVAAAADAGVERVIMVSEIGADPKSAYPVLRNNALEEVYLRESNVGFTIIRHAVLYGSNDIFTIGLAMLASAAPLLMPIPGDGTALLQPLWVEDLATSILWIHEDRATIGETYEVGGPEHLSFSQILDMVAQNIGKRRIYISLRPPYLRAVTGLLERFLASPPLTTAWMDYLTGNRITDLDTLPRVIGLRPARMEASLAYLHDVNWTWQILARQFKRRLD